MSENDVFCLFLAYFLHFSVENNNIVDTLSPLHVIIIILGVFRGVYDASQYYNYISFTHRQLVTSHFFKQKYCALADCDKTTAFDHSFLPKISRVDYFII